MANKAERNAVILSDLLMETQVTTFRVQQNISLKAHDRLEHLMADLSEKWANVQAQWQRMNPSQQAAA